MNCSQPVIAGNYLQTGGAVRCRQWVLGKMCISSMKSVWPYNRIAVNKSTWIVSDIPKCRSTILSFRWPHFRSRSTKVTRSNRWNWKFWVWLSEYVFRPVFRQKRNTNLKHFWTSWNKKKMKFTEIPRNYLKNDHFRVKIPKPVHFEDIYLTLCTHTK